MNDLEKIKNDLQSAVDALTETAKRLKTSAKEAVNKRCEYEAKKNSYLIEMKAEESDDPTIKRTDAIRTAMYRQMFKDERKEWLAAESDYETDVIIFKGLQSKLNAQQTLSRLIEMEHKSGITLEDRFNNLEAQINDIRQETIQ